ncbi:MAG: phosphotransferase [Solobacterium sp.]|nr:phosphotransferase [Solobacterium sp.]
MKLIEAMTDGKVLTIYLIGHVDSNNATDVEAEIREACKANEHENLLIDADRLEYISSAGLRIILRLRREYPDMQIINVNKDVYEVFEMTGFTEMVDIQKAFRRISVEGCEVIGQGANGKVYRIDEDTIVKIYYDQNALPDIKRERELARKAFVLGIPTAIPYDVVRVGDGYGSVYELLNASSFISLMIQDPSRLEELVGMSVDLLKKIHGTIVKPEDMPDMKAVAADWGEFLKDYLPEDQYQKLHDLIAAVPDDNHMMHGDFHLKNVMLQDDEALLIDMDTICHGHPVFEFGSIFNAYQGYCELDHQNCLEFLGIDYETCARIYRQTMKDYFDDKSDEEIEAISRKAQIIGYTRIMRRCIRRNGFDTEEGRAMIENCRKHLGELLQTTDTLLWD